MKKKSVGVLRVLAGAATLALACLAVIYSVEILAFLGDNWMWIIAVLLLWTALSVVLGLVLGPMFRKAGLREPAAAPVAPTAPAAPAAPSSAAGLIDIPSPASPHDSEQGVPLSGPTRRRLTAE